MVRLLGDSNPELAKKYGLDSWQREQFERELQELDQRVKLVTFEEPPEREDGKRDPIAYIPPEFQRYGILDRDHRHRARVGETWFAESMEKGGSIFLIPLARFEPDQLAHWLPNALDQVARLVGQYHPQIVEDHFVKHHVQEAQEAADRIKKLEQQVAEATDTIVALRGERETLQAQLDSLKDSKPAPQAAETPTPTVTVRPKIAPMGASASVGASGAATAVRDYGDVLHSDAFHHSAYLAHFSTDLTRLYLRPDRDGAPCLDGSIEIDGLSRADREPPPKRYELQWDDQISGYVVDLTAS